MVENNNKNYKENIENKLKIIQGQQAFNLIKNPKS